ncbi:MULTISPECIES: hypothetical protein [Pseudoalteromonas]|uniref:hypothetical protein n=1 Tax=Pseudoalteromonas TaxID=53246 RepID=UPI00147ED527|nr:MULTISPECIES: hypothetical protein [Pseudoalteromonas]
MKKDTAEQKPKLTPGQIAEQARAALAEQTDRQNLAGAFTLDDNNKLTTGGK